MFGNNRECASFLVKIANQKKQRIHEARSSSYTWAAYRACIQVFGDTYKDARWQSTFFLLINIVEILQLSAHGEPCKIRHYEKDSLCIFHWILWCLCLCHSQYACRTKGRPSNWIIFFRCNLCCLFYLCFV